MSKQLFRLLLAFSILALISLACEVNTLWTVTHPLEADQTSTAIRAANTLQPTEDEQLLLPTPAPTDAPPAEGAPIVMNLTGTRVEPPPAGYADAKACSTETELRLTIQSNGQAELYSSAPGFVDHYNCVTKGDTLVSWYVYGTANLTSQIVTFSSCNNDNFEAAGEMSYDANGFYGTVSCVYKKTSEKQITISR